jgi:hypothetical protein
MIRMTTLARCQAPWHSWVAMPILPTVARQRPEWRKIAENAGNSRRSLHPVRIATEPTEPSVRTRVAPDDDQAPEVA